MYKIALALLLIFSTCFSFAQEFNYKKLDRYFTVLEESNKFMGSITLRQNGKVIYQRSSGYASIDKNLKANQDTKYRIGGISKTFTAVLVLKAIEEKKLKLNQTIETFFPHLPLAYKINIEQLLRHRTGIDNFTNHTDYYTWNRVAKSDLELIQLITQQERRFEPGSKAEYSSSNYVLLAIILERVFRKSYEELIEEYISKPLGLKNTYVGKEINTDANEALSYDLENMHNPILHTDLSILLGAGNIASTPADLTLFIDGLFSYKLLKKKSTDLMLTIQDDFGVGLVLAPFYNHVGYGHIGKLDGFSSILSFFPKNQLSYAIISNGSKYAIDELSNVVLSAFFNKEYTIPEASNSYTPTVEELNQYLGIYLSPELPVEIMISKENNILMLEATNHDSVPLKVIEKDTFSYEPADVEIVFYPSEKTLVLHVADDSFDFKKAN